MPKKATEVRFSSNGIASYFAEGGRAFDDIPLFIREELLEKVKLGLIDRDTKVSISAWDVEMTIGQMIDQGIFGKLDLPARIEIPKIQDQAMARALLAGGIAIYMAFPSTNGADALKSLIHRAREAGLSDEEVTGYSKAATEVLEKRNGI